MKKQSQILNFLFIKGGIDLNSNLKIWFANHQICANFRFQNEIMGLKHNIKEVMWKCLLGRIVIEETKATKLNL